MFNWMGRKLKSVRWGNQSFVEASLPYRGEDSVLRLSPASMNIFQSDLAGGGAVCGYYAAQGSPSILPHMVGTADLNGSGLTSGYGRQPGQLLDLAQKKVVAS